MSNAFPTDVSLRLDNNDLEGSQQLIPRAANLLYKALKLQEAGDRPVVRLFQSDPNDGSFVSVFLTGQQKHVYVQPGPRPQGVKTPSEPSVTPPKPKVYINDMWSGIARAPVGNEALIVSVPNPAGDEPPTVPALSIFHPDLVTATAYAEGFVWQTPPRLGINNAGLNQEGIADCAFPKPSMYSGAMKRVVSAVLGLGHTVTETPGYISNELPPEYPDYNAFNQYDYLFERTHGIYKGEDGGVWIVEISQLNGVLAMPLPIFDGTDDDGYLSWLGAVGDTDTMAVVFEFGGLPTGEPFPTGDALEDAIEQGLVVPLLSPDAIADFYYDSINSRSKFGLSARCGWAFSDSGHLAANVCMWRSHPSISLAPASDWTTDGFGSAPADQRYQRSQLWRITITLLLATVDEPISGSASIELVEDGIMVQTSDARPGPPNFDDVYNHSMVQVPFLEDDALKQYLYFGRADIFNPTVDDAIGGAPMHVFYVGETIEVVRQYGTPYQSPQAQPYFKGDTLDLGDNVYTILGPSSPNGTYTNTFNIRIGLIIPAYTREAYVLCRFTYDNSVYGNTLDASGADAAFATTGTAGDVQCFAYYADYGIVEGGVVAMDPVRPPDPQSAFVTPWYAKLTNYLFPHVIHFAATVNTGPLRAYVAHDNIETDATVQFDPDATIHTQSGSLADFDIPENTPARQITFVGSCSDG